MQNSKSAQSVRVASSAPQPSSARNLGPAPAESSILLTVFLVLFAQLVSLILASLVLHAGPTFVGRDPKGFGTDFLDFYMAGLYYSHHLSPYATGRFVWPPFAILLALLANLFPWETARYLWLLPNLGCIAGGLIAFSRQVKLGTRNTVLLLMIAGLFYPVHFLLERGHIDGLMMACMVLAFGSRGWLRKSLFLGLSIGLKLYSALLLALLARKKQFAALGGTIAVAVLLQLPWPQLLSDFLQRLALRTTTQWIEVENITPAPLFHSMLGSFGEPLWKLAFLLFWLMTLLWTLLHLQSTPGDSADWVLLAPWMFSMPLVVYPYTAVLSLPLIAYQAIRWEGKRWGAGEWLLVVGFLLVGTQQNAWIELLIPFSDKALLIYRMNSLGTAILMVSCCLLASRVGENRSAPAPTRN